MPAKSEPQRRLMAAAAHGATFKKARDVRKSMTLRQLQDFSARVESTSPVDDKEAAGVRHQPAHRQTAGREPASGRVRNNLGQYLHPKKAR